MSKKDNIFSNWPNQSGYDFSEADEVLNYKPKIKYQGEVSLERATILQKQSRVLTEARKKVDDLRAAYQVIEQLAEIAQKRLDERVGNYKISLNDQVDAQVKDALQRTFPELKDTSEISYEMYKQCVDRLCAATEAPTLSAESVATARKNPKKTDFGGLGAKAGDNRKEVDSASSGLKPLDLEAFQDAVVKKLHKKMGPLNQAEHDATIRKHMADTPHG